MESQRIVELLAPYLPSVGLSDLQVAQVSRYLDLLLHWNSKINLTGVYNGLYYGCRMLAERGGGSVISTASILGLVGATPMPVAEPLPFEYGNGAYQASKGAVVQMTRQFAVAFAGRGVRVNAIAPGYIVTPMTAVLRDNEAYEAHLIGLHPIGRLGQAEEIASAAAFLASGDASFITGVTLPVDGGYTAR